MVNAAMFPALRRVGERCVFWSIQPEGRRPVPAPRQIAHVMDRARPGAIVDLHDAEGTRAAPVRLLRALPPLLEGLRERDYAFATVAELLHPGD
jgi:peptidoglycan/xylan/chitin deacetylase (PgdA/CDA1 family)